MSSVYARRRVCVQSDCSFGTPPAVGNETPLAATTPKPEKYPRSGVRRCCADGGPSTSRSNNSQLGRREGPADEGAAAAGFRQLSVLNQLASARRPLIEKGPRARRTAVRLHLRSLLHNRVRVFREGALRREGNSKRCVEPPERGTFVGFPKVLGHPRHASPFSFTLCSRRPRGGFNESWPGLALTAQSCSYLHAQLVHPIAFASKTLGFLTG